MKGRFNKKTAAVAGKKGGLKIKRKFGKKYFAELAQKRWSKI